MKIDVLVAEIGSTTTVVNAFQDINTLCPKFIGQGQAPTSVLEGDVNIGLNSAISDLANKINAESIEYEEMLATSSAAGGLKMSVHGLVYDMTVKAAREAALGAGAIIHNATAGKLRKADLKRIKNMNVNIILLAGGVDHGERETALYNAEKISKLGIKVPIIYAGNVDNQEEIKEIFEEAGMKLYIVENVYPKIDQLNIEPTRKIIQDVFEEHIVHAPGMAKVRELVNGPIIPTPGAVMKASELLKEDIGDLITFDVGGATTDLHSVTEGSEEINRILISPEPIAKRSVEGDLGVYVNMENIVGRIGIEEIEENLQIGIDALKRNHQPIPKTKKQIEFVEMLTKEAVETAIERHVGEIRHIYGPNGKATVAEGKDLSNVKYIVGTGGALTKLDKGKEILKALTNNNTKNKLQPTNEAKVVIDKDYIMASVGVLSKSHPKSALKLLKKSCNIE
ncbi:MAG: DNA mismatch repair protein MutL [Alkaliphilus sp.]|nr:glutamate mutase L [bacterium AH-315-E09]PHS35442.1 MAG: DNA mismatch repair protein MutL [Alkaliphilus sp.]